MAKTNVRTIPLGTYAAGTYEMASVSIGQQASSFEIAISRASLPNTSAVVASISIEGSDDGGSTWQALGGITLVGGVAHNPDGSVAAESSYAQHLDNSKPGTYKLRGSAVLFQQLTTSARLTVF